MISSTLTSIVNQCRITTRHGLLVLQVLAATSSAKMQLPTLFMQLCIVIWAFATLIDGQGGSYGFTSAALADTTNCAVLSSRRSNYFSCINFGSATVSTPFQITPGSTDIVYGTGTYAAVLMITNTGPSAFAGYQVAYTSRWTASETNYNCTLACRSHGMKYAIMYGGYCGCSPFLNLPKTPKFLQTATIQLVPDYLYIDANSLCLGTGVPSYPNPPMNCLGDGNQPQCGVITGPGMNQNGVQPAGLVAGSVWLDNSFNSDSVLLGLLSASPSASYAFLSCFRLSQDKAQTFLPANFSNTFPLGQTSNCFLFCAKLNMPYAAMRIASFVASIRHSLT